MRFRYFFPILLALSLAAFDGFGQTKPKPTPNAAAAVSPAKATAAYAEVLLRKTELTAEVEALLAEYTEQYPKVAELRYETGRLQKELDRLLAVDAAGAARLSSALGRLMVRKCELETDLWKLRDEYSDEHPEVKRAKRRVELFEAAIADILPGR